MDSSIKDTEYATKIHNLTFVRKRGILKEEFNDISALNTCVANFYNKVKSFYQETNIQNTSGFFRINKQYYLAVYINGKECRGNPYLFIYDRINDKPLDIIDYDLIMELKDKSLWIIDAVDLTLQKNYSMVSEQVMQEMTDMALRFDEEMER